MPGELVAYGRVLLDVLSGRTGLSVSAEESEATWRLVEPVLDAWADGAPPSREYRAGLGPSTSAPPGAASPQG